MAIAQAKARNAAKAKAAAAAKIQSAAAAAVEAQAQRAQAVKKLEDQIFIAKVVQFKKPTSDKIRDKVVHGIMELGMGGQRETGYQLPYSHRLEACFCQCCGSEFGSGSVGSICVFGPPGSGSLSQRYGSGSFYHQAKILNSKKSLDSYCFVTFFYFLPLKNYLNVP